MAFWGSKNILQKISKIKLNIQNCEILCTSNMTLLIVLQLKEISFPKLCAFLYTSDISYQESLKYLHPSYWSHMITCEYILYLYLSLSIYSISKEGYSSVILKLEWWWYWTNFKRSRSLRILMIFCGCFNLCCRLNLKMLSLMDDAPQCYKYIGSPDVERTLHGVLIIWFPKDEVII